MRLRLWLSHVCREQAVLARTVTWCASLAAFCKGGTKSPPSPLCLIMLIMDSNSIIAGNECMSIVLPPGDNWKKIWLSFFLYAHKKILSYVLACDLRLKSRCEEPHPCPAPKWKWPNLDVRREQFAFISQGREFNAASPNDATVGECGVFLA